MSTLKFCVESMIINKPKIVKLLKEIPKWGYYRSAMIILDSLSSFHKFDMTFGQSIRCMKLNFEMMTMEQFLIVVDALSIVRLWTLDDNDSFSFFDLVNVCFDGKQKFIDVIVSRYPNIDKNRIEKFYLLNIELQKLLAEGIVTLNKYTNYNQETVYRCCSAGMPQTQYFTSFTKDLSIAESFLTKKVDPLLISTILPKSKYILDISQLKNLSASPKEKEILCVGGLLKYKVNGQNNNITELVSELCEITIPEPEYFNDSIMCMICISEVGKLRACDATTENGYGHRLCQNCFSKVALCPMCRRQKCQIDDIEVYYLYDSKCQTSYVQKNTYYIHYTPVQCRVILFLTGFLFLSWLNDIVVITPIGCVLFLLWSLIYFFTFSFKKISRSYLNEITKCDIKCRMHVGKLSDQLTNEINSMKMIKKSIKDLEKEHNKKQIIAERERERTRNNSSNLYSNPPGYGGGRCFRPPTR